MDPWATQDEGREIGFVRSSKQYLLTLEGLPNVRVHDILENDEGGRLLVTALHEDTVEALALDVLDTRPGVRFFLTDRHRQLYIGERLFGRVISALGAVLDEKEPLPRSNASIELEREAPGIIERAPITEQFVTGLPLIDSVLPIGRGQRELLMGSVRSGIEQFVREVVLNQEGGDTVTVYCALGKSPGVVRAFANDLLTPDTASRTIIVSASAQDLTPLIYIAPAVAFSIARHFEREGRHVLLILDDLYTHAKYLREIALLAGRLPGRESYPGDIFYQHAHLIEQAGSFMGGATITLLPILRTDIEGYNDLITTNIMGTTDGHLSFSPLLFARGHHPPITVEESVTRVGKHTQSPIGKLLGAAIISTLSDLRANEKFTRFGGELSEAVRTTLMSGSALLELLSVKHGTHYALEAQTIVLSLPFTSFTSGDRDGKFFREHKEKLYDAATRHKNLEDLRRDTLHGTSFTEFLRKVEAQRNIFEHVCQQ